MIVVCGWCGRTQGQAGEEPGETTTICPECFRAQAKEACGICALDDPVLPLSSTVSRRNDCICALV